MARIGRLYYIVVNKTTGRIDNNCSSCKTVNTNIKNGLPTVDNAHDVHDLSRSDYQTMNVYNQALGGFRNKWSKGQGKPVEDK